MAIKGFRSSKKLKKVIPNIDIMKTEDIEQYVTLNQLPSDRVGADVIMHGLYAVNSIPVTPSAGSDLRKVIFPASHNLKVGDVLRFVTNQTEAPVLGIIDSVTVILACELDFDPTTDTVTTWRYTTPSFDKNGSLSVSGGAVQYNEDGSTVTVTRDHTTLANNNALPVEVLDAAGNSVMAQVAADIASVKANQTNATQLTKITDGAGTVNTKQLGTAVTNSDVGLITNSVIHGLNSAGGGSYVDVKVNPSGALTVEANVTSSVLPTGASTSANQTNGLQKTQIVDGSGNSVNTVQYNSLNSIRTANAGSDFIFSTVNSSSVQLAASATFTGSIETVLSATAISILLTSDQNGTLTINQFIDLAGTRKAATITFPYIANGNFARSIPLNANYVQILFQNTGGSTTTTFRLDTAYGQIDASTSLGNIPMALNEVSGTAMTLGQQGAATSFPVALPNEQVNDLFITGQAAQTAVVNNIIPATAGANATDCTGYRSGCVQIVSTGTAGAFIFEGSNDNVNFQTIPVWNQLILTGTPITAAITPTASQIGYIFPITFRYLRVRISTLVTGGSIQAFTKLSQASFAPPIQQIAQATAANLNATVAGTVTVGSITAGTNVIGNVGVGVVSNTDQTSLAITTTTTGAAKTITNGSSVSITVNITVVSGTSPTYDFKVQESNDGTIWTDIWQAPRATAVSSIVTPALRIRGTQYRYVETIGGTTPSFTRTITSARMPHAGELIRNIVDRTIAPITTNSTTPSLYVEGCSYYAITVFQGAGGSSVTFAIDGSMDNTNWVQNIKQINGVVSGVVQGYATGGYKFIRARVVTGVASTTLNYLQLQAKENGIDSSPYNMNGSSSGTTSVTTAVSVAPPAGAIGFILQCEGTTFTNPIRFRTSGTATTTSGFLLQPGQDTGYVPGAPTLSIVSQTGTAGYNLEWILQ